MDLYKMVELQEKATSLILSIEASRFAGKLDDLRHLEDLISKMSALGGARSVSVFQRILVEKFELAFYSDVESGPAPLIAEDQLHLLLSIAPFIRSEPLLKSYSGISDSLDRQILMNLQWCMIEDPQPGRIHDYYNVFAASHQDYALTILDCALRLPEISASIFAARDILNIMSGIPAPWPQRMHTLLEDNLATIESFASVEDHWFETLAIIPNLCEAGYEQLAQAIFNNIRFSSTQLDPALLDIAHQYFGNKGLESKIPDLIIRQRGKIGLSTDELQGILFLADRYPNMDFPKKEWREVEKSGSIFYLAPAIGRFLRSVSRRKCPDDQLMHPDGVNSILMAVIDGAKEKTNVKKSLMDIAGKDVPKKILLQLDCFQEDILAADLGL
jgi:hypothetical protein